MSPGPDPSTSPLRGSAQDEVSFPLQSITYSPHPERRAKPEVEGYGRHGLAHMAEADEADIHVAPRSAAIRGLYPVGTPSLASSSRVARSAISMRSRCSPLIGNS